MIPKALRTQRILFSRKQAIAKSISSSIILRRSAGISKPTIFSRIANNSASRLVFSSFLPLMGSPHFNLFNSIYETNGFGGMVQKHFLAKKDSFSPKKQKIRKKHGSFRIKKPLSNDSGIYDLNQKYYELSWSEPMNGF